MSKVIYDFGANNGDDIPYYLLKADRVVAVEANSDLCEIMRTRFEEEIEKGRLVVENYVLSERPGSGEVQFFIHKTNHVLSQFPEPPASIRDEFIKVVLPSITPVELIAKYGHPHYIKIDLESFDQVVLSHLFEHQIFPDFLSSEAHSPEILDILSSTGHYGAFKLVEGHSVHEKYHHRSYKLRDSDQWIQYHFPEHSAGPFGDDIDGAWISIESMRSRLRIRGFGWKDIHAAREPDSLVLNPSWISEFVHYLKDASIRLAKEIGAGKMSFKKLVRLLRKRLKLS